MRNLFFLFILGIAAYKGWEYYHKPTPTPSIPVNVSTPYLTVYGKDSCGLTQKTLKELSEAGVRFKYRRLDEKSAHDALMARFKEKSIRIGGAYPIPVVDLNNEILFQPNNAELIRRAKALAL